MNGLDHSVEAALDFARRFAESYTPQPAVALLAGSRIKGTAAPTSDYDVVFLYTSLTEGAWREMVLFEDGTVELFAHDLKSLSYFLSEIELPSGEASLACMVDQGIPIIGEGAVIETAAKDLARTFLRRGPLPLSDAAVLQRRYSITDMAESLKGTTSKARRLAAGSALYPALANFALTTSGCWAAGGKAIPVALHSLNPHLEQEFTEAFERLFSDGEDSLVQELVSKILEPYGGVLRAGFRQQAPAAWRK